MSKRRLAIGGFTLVELLIVLAIIALLVALILPAALGARRRALVLVSPVTYLGMDGQVHLTGRNGRVDIPLIKNARNDCPYCHTPPAWSPDGLRLAVQTPLDAMSLNTAFATRLVNPSSGTVDSLPEPRGKAFMCWLDSDRYLTGPTSGEMNAQAPFLYVHDTQGNLLKTLANPHDLIALYPAPACAPAPYVGVTVKGRMTPDAKGSVVLVDKNFTPGRVIWTSADHSVPQNPRMDPFGQYVAWTQMGNSSTYAVAFKHVNDPPSSPPFLVARQYSTEAAFCDWTDGGEMLVNLKMAPVQWQLVILDMSGRIEQTLQTDARPAAGSCASWRRYEHR